MSWENEIASIEHSNDWRLAIELLKKQNFDNPEIYLRVMFLLLDLVVEGQYTQEEHDYAAKNLREIFNESNQKFSNIPEFLFFTGIMIYIGEWYFGMDSVDSATDMLSNAMRMEPDNILYKWGYYSTIDQRPEQNTELKLQLSEKLLFKETTKLNWLKSKGILGRYVIGTLEGTYEAVKEIKASQ